MSLRKRWRSKQKQRPDLGSQGSSKSRKRQGQGFDSNTSFNDDAVSQERLEFLAEKALGSSGRGARSGSGSGGSGKVRSSSDAMAAELEELARGLGMGKASEFDGDELEMAARLVTCGFVLCCLFVCLCVRMCVCACFFAAPTPTNDTRWRAPQPAFFKACILRGEYVWFQTRVPRSPTLPFLGTRHACCLGVLEL